MLLGTQIVAEVCALAQQVAQFLLSRNLYLTALELLVEGEETGHEDEVDLLRVGAVGGFSVAEPPPYP